MNCALCLLLSMPTASCSSSRPTMSGHVATSNCERMWIVYHRATPFLQDECSHARTVRAVTDALIKHYLHYLTGNLPPQTSSETIEPAASPSAAPPSTTSIALTTPASTSASHTRAGSPPVASILFEPILQPVTID
jgi:hypothetical protein